MGSANVRVIVADDNALVREGLLRVLGDAGFDVVAAVSNANDLLAKAEAMRPDVVLADIQMPPRMQHDGLEAVLRLRDSQPEIGVIVLSQYLEDRYALDLVGERADGVGYLLKEKIADADLLVEAVRRVASGGSALDPDVIARLVGRKRADSPVDQLTPREREVLGFMAEGRSNAGIAKQMSVTVPAVERHVTNIFNKLGLQQSGLDQHRRVLAVLRYLQT